MRTAELRGASALVIELNTPGGSVDTMANLVQQLRASPLPVIVYVSPERGDGSLGGDADHPGGACGGDGARNDHRRGQPGRFAGRGYRHDRGHQGQRGDEGHGALAGVSGAARKRCAWPKR